MSQLRPSASGSSAAAGCSEQAAVGGGAGDVASAPARAPDEVEELRREVRRLASQKSRLEAELRQAGGLHGAFGNDREVEVVRLEVVRSSAARSAASGVDAPHKAAASFSAVGPLFCCQGHTAASCQEVLVEEDHPAALAVEDGDEDAYEEIASGPLAKARRTAETLFVGASLHLSVKRLERELSGSTLSEVAIEEKWESLHKRNADMVFNHIMKHRGFFIKVGQKASTMAGTLPEPWVQALTPLQDHIPTTPYHIVRRIVRQDLGASLDDIFGEFEPKPIASASIGQAHVARLRSGGEKVCVKIGHPGVAELAEIDLDNIEFLVRMLMRLHDEAPDITETVKEMRRASLEEVDFRLEAQNAKDALNALQHAGSPVGCSEPLAHFCGQQVLTMRFIEGWKITETERLPPGTNRELMAAQIVEAYAMLVFEEGLIHGDPHPGNIFVEQISEGPDGVRPVLLDWGIAKRITREERVALCKWVVASLSRDRFLYMQTLKELGVDFGEGIDYKTLDMLMFTAVLLLRDTLPSSAMKQYHDQFRAHADAEKKKKRKAHESEGKRLQKVVEKVPGWVHFFFRGLSMVQDVCGMLDVTVPVAKILLRYALPKVHREPRRVPTGLPGADPAGRPELERQVVARLAELGDGLLLGAQVAVLVDDAEGGSPGSWACNASCGLAGLRGLPLTSATLMPLLDAGVGVLVACLLGALAKPTATGKEVGLDTPVERLWPEFARAGKGGTSVLDLLQHRAGLGRPFRRKTTFTSVCNEKFMEEAIADCPRSKDEGDRACRVLGVALAALLKRATGRKAAAEAVRAVLEPLGLHEDICYQGRGRDVACVGHRLLEEVPTSVLWELLEDRMAQSESQDDEGKRPPAWLSYEQLVAEQPWCADPLLANSPELLEGRGCAAGRGLRATAQAVCRLYASGLVPPSLLERSTAQRRRLGVASLAEWEDLGRCLEVGAGWQLFKFRRLDGSGTVTGHGHVDGATGSVALRIPGASIAILLTCVDQEARHVGHELLTAIAGHFGLAPVWHADVPKGVPEKAPRPGHEGEAKKPGSEVEESVRNMSQEVQRLRQMLEHHLGRTAGGPAGGAHGSDLVGAWESAETEGLDELLEAVNVPVMARTLAKRLKRALAFEVSGEHISLSSRAVVAGRQVEDSSVTFRPGDPFEMQQPWGGTCGCHARWEDSGARAALVLEKRLAHGGLEAALLERFEVTEAGRLAVSTTLVGKGSVTVALDSASDLDLLQRSVDPKSSRLTREVKLSNGEMVMRSGRLVSHTAAELAAVQLPGTVELLYSDLRSTTLFDASGGRPAPRRRGRRGSTAPAAAEAPPRPAARCGGGGCLCGLRSLARGLAAGLRAAAGCLESGCAPPPRPAPPRQAAARRASELSSAEAGFERQASELSEAIGMTRRLQRGLSGDLQSTE